MFGGVSMTKERYREKIEEDRLEIEVEKESTRMSRTNRNKKPRKSYGMKVLLVIFIFIPLACLLYVKFFYVPEVPDVAQSEENQNEVKYETTNLPSNSKVDDSKEEEEDNNAEDLAAKQAEEEKKKAEEQAKKEEEQRLAEEKRKEEERKAAEEEKKQQEANRRKHVVQSGDTLFSIAMKYYNDPSAVDKIKKANNLSSNSIPAGFELVLP